MIEQRATRCGCRCVHPGWIMEAIRRSDAVKVIEHRFNRNKSAIYTIERRVWRFVEPGGIVEDSGRAMWHTLEYSTPDFMDGSMNGRRREWSFQHFCIA